MKTKISELYIGQRVDLEGDSIADPDTALKMGSTAHPEFEFEFETVMEIERETANCILVVFESGFSCGFPPGHMVDVDGEQVRERA